MPENLEEFIQDCGKPKTLKERMSYEWRRVKKKTKNGLKWITEHPQEAAITATLVTGLGAVAKTGFKTVNKLVTARRETYNKQRFVYDHSTGSYLKTSRALKSNDVRRINEMRANHPGMKMSEALEKLNILD